MACGDVDDQLEQITHSCIAQITVHLNCSIRTSLNGKAIKHLQIYFPDNTELLASDGTTNIRLEELTKRDSMVVLLLKVKILVINDFAFEHLFAINYGLRQ